MTLHKFIAEYKENAKKRCMSVTSVKVILYAAWGSIILLNLVISSLPFSSLFSHSWVSMLILSFHQGALVASFLFEAPGVHLFRLEKNYYEHRCSFRQTFLFILPSTIVCTLPPLFFSFLFFSFLFFSFLFFSFLYFSVCLFFLINLNRVPCLLSL